MTTWAYLDGRVLPAEEARVPALDRGFLVGDGAFEVYRTYGGKAFRLGAHLDRLEATLARLRIPLPIPRREIEAGLAEIVRRAGTDVAVRLTVTRGEGGEGYLPPRDPRGRVFAHTRPLPDVAALRARGLAAVIARARRAGVDVLDPALKTTSGAPLVLARLEAADAGADEAILLNGRGEVAEGTHSNVFAVRAGRIATPPLVAGILAGVTRAAVLEIADVAETTLAPDDLRTADEIFVTYTSAGPVPVVSLDGAPVGAGRPGPVTLDVVRRFDDLVRRECA